MDRSVQEFFANSYPVKEQKQEYQQNKQPVNRTPVTEIYNSPKVSYPKVQAQAQTQSQSTTQSHSIYKLIVVVTIICILSVVIFSSYMYTVTDHIVSPWSINLFDDTTGQPGYIVQGIHTFILGLLVFFILYTVGT